MIPNLISRRHLFVKILCIHCERTESTRANCAYLGVYVGDLLDRTPLSRSAMTSSDDAPISTLSELLHKLVLGINDEGRVKCCELMPLHCNVNLSEAARKEVVVKGEYEENAECASVPFEVRALKLMARTGCPSRWG